LGSLAGGLLLFLDNKPALKTIQVYPLKIDAIDVDSAINHVKQLLKTERDLSPALKSALEVILLLVSRSMVMISISSGSSIFCSVVPICDFYPPEDLSGDKSPYSLSFTIPVTVLQTNTGISC
jgi:hypothetical protein